ncbi:hypothetical protein IM763_09460 [Atopobiaceae bacterium FL090493]|nr:hypothetical protein [Atopobiaceae bacterium FL090493]
MRLFLTVLLVQLKAVYARPEKCQKASVPGRAAALLLSGVACVLVLCFMGYCGFSLQAAGAGIALPVLSALLALACGAVASFPAAADALFAAEDYRFSMSLPIPEWVHVVTRLVPLYLAGAFFAAWLVVPLWGGAASCDAVLLSPVHMAAVVACSLLVPALALGAFSLLGAGIVRHVRDGLPDLCGPYGRRGCAVPGGWPVRFSPLRLVLVHGQSGSVPRRVESAL